MDTEYHRANSRSIPSEEEYGPVNHRKPPKDHHSIETGGWDGQLTNTKILQGIEPDHSVYPGPVDRRQWATAVGIKFNLSLAERSILQSYAHDCGTPQGCWKSADKMAYELGCHEKSIREARGKLISLKVLNDEGRRKRAQRVTLNFNVTGPQARFPLNKSRTTPPFRQEENQIKADLTAGYENETGLETRIAGNVTGTEPHLQRSSNETKPELSSGLEAITGPEARSNPGVSPGKLKGTRSIEREESDNRSLDCRSYSSSPGLRPGLRPREPTHEDVKIETRVTEKWDLLEEAGWKRLDAAIRHYQRHGLEYLRRDLERKQVEVDKARLTARTCVHCKELRDSAEELEACHRCEGLICKSLSRPCRQKTCFRRQGGHSRGSVPDQMRR